MNKKPKQDIPPGTNEDFVLPDGFKAVTPLEGEQCWWRKEAGAVLYGRMVGRFPRRDDSGAYYQIRLFASLKASVLLHAIKGAGDEAETIEVGEGTVVNVDETSSISNLAPYALSDGVYDVMVHCAGKIKISGGRTYWRMTAGVKQIKAPSSPIQMTAQDKQAADIPF